VRVILQPTSFDPGQILVTSYRDGGMSAVPDSELVPAATALPLVSESGLGAFDADALRKRLSGTLAHVGGAIGPYGEGVWGQAPPKDLTTLFQLLYLEFTAPRLDSAVFRHYESQLREALAHRAASPEAAFEDTLALLLADHSPRVRVLDTTYVRALDAAKSLAFFRSRFADATGFTFVIVGAFDRDSIRPLVARYLGGLPASGGWGRWRDTGERPPSGITVRVVRKGTEPKAALALVFHGRAETSLRERVLLRALADVLQQRLWEELRETLGGVYGVSVTAEQEAVPVPEYRLTVRFGADPERIEGLRREVFAQVSRLEADGPTAVELEKFREAARRERETAARTNAFWLQTIALYDQRGWDFEGLGDDDRIADTITPSDVREAARRYLDLSRYVQVMLLPEDER
ncbi:MAG TPA: insulinase family protein, partial [Gemmatimonadaceae bacterium]|nr:insulinase family protein [Gemmatimonadaceae bacterium]